MTPQFHKVIRGDDPRLSGLVFAYRRSHPISLPLLPAGGGEGRGEVGFAAKFFFPLAYAAPPGRRSSLKPTSPGSLALATLSPLKGGEG